LFFAGEAGVFGNRFDAVRGFLQAPTGYVNANCFYGFRGRAAARLCKDSREVSFA
jgi:hypothetical protein